MKAFLSLCLLFTLSLAKSNQWDFLFFVQRWAGTAGYGHTLPNALDIFTVHGLWPSRFDGSYPSYCNNSQPFDPVQIGSLVSQLNLIWYNYQSGSADSFWSHEWEKHGTCAESLSVLNTEYKFFYYVIKLHNSYDLIGTLKAKGFPPSAQENYKVSDISDAIKGSFALPALTCQSTGLGQSLLRMGLCMDKSFNLIDCPSSAQNNNCGEYAYIPPINYSD